jgi:hypothetical protein
MPAHFPTPAGNGEATALRGSNDEGRPVLPAALDIKRHHGA